MIVSSDPAMSIIPRPLLFVDIDGVLNPYGPQCPQGYVEHCLFPEDDLPVRVCEDHGNWLRELAGPFDLIWGSAWSTEEREMLARLLPLPTFQDAVELPRGPFDPALKVPAISKMAGNRPLAWMDDMLTETAWTWATNRDAPTLLVPVDPDAGLMLRHVRLLLEWATTLVDTHAGSSA